MADVPPPNPNSAHAQIWAKIDAAHPIDPNAPHDPAVLQKRREMWQAEAGKHTKAYYEAKAKIGP